MSEGDSCFICLEYCNKRICSECKCFAHDKCFAKYINKSLSLESIIKHTVEKFELEIFTFVSCPVCKTEIENHNKRITRSDTYNYRFEYVLYMLNYYLCFINYDTTNDINRIENLLDKLLKIAVKFKSTILKNDKLNEVIKNKLKVMNKTWSKANLYYYELYGTQLKV
jgi:hypothetical protein